MINTSDTRKFCIFGAGGFGREVITILVDLYCQGDTQIEEIACFMVSDEFYDSSSVMGVPVIKESEFCQDDYKVIVAVGDPHARKEMVDRLPENTQYATAIHPSAILSKWVEVGEGSVIAAGTSLTCNITLGKHTHLNPNTTIGHDCAMGDFFTAAPAVSISGNCVMGDLVYFGTKAATRQRVNVCSNVTVGMCAVVLNDIEQTGTYVGSPLRRLQR